MPGPGGGITLQMDKTNTEYYPGIRSIKKTTVPDPRLMAGKPARVPVPREIAGIPTVDPAGRKAPW